MKSKAFFVVFEKLSFGEKITDTSFKLKPNKFTRHKMFY